MGIPRPQFRPRLDSGFARLRPAGFAGRPGMTEKSSGRRATAREEAPHHQHDDGADHGTDQARPLVGAVPAERLAEIGRDEGTGDAEGRGEDEARRLVGAGVEEFRDDAGNEADDDEPDYSHLNPPLGRLPTRYVRGGNARVELWFRRSPQTQRHART